MRETTRARATDERRALGGKASKLVARPTRLGLPLAGAAAPLLGASAPSGHASLSSGAAPCALAAPRGAYSDENLVSSLVLCRRSSVWLTASTPRVSTKLWRAL